MKNTKTILRLLVACFLLGAILWAVDTNPPPIEPDGKGRLIPEALKEVDRVIITRKGDVQIDLQRESMSNWQIVRPISAPAATDVVMSMLDTFERASYKDCIDRDEMALRGLSQVDFGGNPPRGEIVFSGPRARVELGAGASSAVSDELFVFKGTSVFVTDSSILKYFEMPVEAFSDTRIFRNNPRKANVVTLNRGPLGFVKLVRDPGYREWKLTQPCRTRADWDAMAHLFEVLYSARIVRYARDDFPPEAIPAGGYGLDGVDAVVVQIATPEDPAGQVLTIGSPLSGAGDLVFVRPGTDGMVSVVTGAVRRVALQTVSDLRDKSLFNFASPPTVRAFSIESGTHSLAFKLQADGVCLMTAPLPDRAASPAVSRLLDSLLGLAAVHFTEVDPEDLGGAPVATISVDTEGEDYKFTFAAVPTNAAPEATEDLFYAIPGDVVRDPSTPVITLPVVSSSALSPFFAAAADPRPLLSRRLLSLEAKDIQRISSVQGGVTSAVELVEGEWRSPSSTNAPAMDVVGKWLEALSDLEALRVQALSEGENDIYSLENPSRTLTIDVVSGPSPRIVLLLGGKSPDGGVYCRLQGHDAVFVLPETIEKTFARPVDAPPALPKAADGPDRPVPTTSAGK